MRNLLEYVASFKNSKQNLCKLLLLLLALTTIILRFVFDGGDDGGGAVVMAAVVFKFSFSFMRVSQSVVTTSVESCDNCVCPQFTTESEKTIYKKRFFCFFFCFFSFLSFWKIEFIEYGLLLRYEKS